jgi:hypothetical protein
MPWRSGLVLLPVVALVMGCASAGDPEWVKANASDEQRERDKADCLFDSMEIAGTARTPGQRVNQDRYHRCLEARGYQLRSTPGSR